MGLYDREYYRDDYARRERWQFGPVTLLLAIATTVPFFVQMALAKPMGKEFGFQFRDPILDAGGFVLDKILSGEVWRLVTNVFLHNVNMGTSLWLLGGGLLVLVFCGKAVEGTYGSKEVFWFYIASILVTQIMLFVVSYARPFGFVGPNPGYGSAGPTTAILVLFACLSKETQIPVLFLSIRAGHLATGVILVNMLLFVSSRYQYPPAIPILAGAAFAFSYHRFHWRVSSWIPDLPGLRANGRTVVKSRPAFRIEPDTNREIQHCGNSVPQSAVGVASKTDPAIPRPTAVDEQLEAQMDQVLAKMSQFGRESITEQERDILKRASELYKKRRS